MLPKCIWAFGLLLRKYSGNVSSPDLFLESTFHLAHSLQFSSVRRSFLLAGSPVASTTARLQLLCLSSTTTTGGVETLANPAHAIAQLRFVPANLYATPFVV
jgi:hypothetical protein